MFGRCGATVVFSWLLVAALFFGFGENAHATIAYYDTASEANAGCLAAGARAKVHSSMVKAGFYCYYFPFGTVPSGAYTCRVYGTYTTGTNKWDLGCEVYDNSLENDHAYVRTCDAGQTWDDQTRQCGVPNADKNLGAPSCKDGCFGDPINAGNGNKFETVVDYESSGGLLPLKVEWTYNSTDSAHSIDPSQRIFGKKRTAHNAQSIRKIAAAAGNGDIAYFTHADGKVSAFYKNAQEWSAYAGTKLRLAATYTSGAVNNWTLTDGSGSTYQFSAEGRLSSVSNRQGGLNLLQYDTLGRLERVTDESGRQLVYAYNANGYLDNVTLPDGGLLAYEYDPSGYLIRTVYPDGSSRQYAYNEAGLVAAGAAEGLLTGVIDETGSRYSTTTYDTSRALQTYLAGGLDQTSATYQLNANQTYNAQAAIELPSNATRAVVFDSINGRILPASTSTTCIGCVAQTTTYSYDFYGFPDLVTRNGTVTDHTFNARGFETRRVVAANAATEKRTIQTDWHATDNPAERRTYNAANKLISKSTYTYNLRGQALTASQIDPVISVTRTTTMAYCESVDVTAGTCPLVGLPKSVDGPRTDVSDITTYTYYPSDDASCASTPTTCPHRKGDLWKVTNALGQVTETLAYDGAGRLLSVKDANGVITDLEYHPRGWLIASKIRGTDAAVETDDAITRLEYWPTGLVKKVVQPEGAFTAYTYDAAHRLTQIADNAGNKIVYTLDNAGNRTQEDTQDPQGGLKRTLSRVYNQLGQLQTQADAQANPTDFTYDANGSTDTVTDALGRVTDNDYDPLNRLSRTLQNVGGINAETKFAYDVQDNLTKVTDPKGLNTTYAYNGLGDLTQLVSPDTGTTKYTYDSAGNPKTQTDARNQTSTYSYDALNRLTGIAYATSTLNVGYTYDATQAACDIGETFSTGRLTQLADASGTTQYCYDRFGNLVRKVQTTNGIAFTVRYAYTLAGQLSSVTYPDGAIASYVRDAQGRTTQVDVQRAGATTEVLLNQASYHPFGPVAGWTYGNGRQLLRPLNQNYQPTAVQDASAGGLSVGFAYDPVGNLTQLTPAGGATPLVKFDYDALSRLTTFKDGPTDVAIESYAYDATGNRQSFTNSVGTQAYTYPSINHRLTQVGATVRSYDNAGNTTAIGGVAKEFVYDDTGRMSQIKQNAIVQRNYTYNGKGEQVRKYLGATSTYTVYDEAGHWLGDYDNTGAALQQALWLDDLPVGLIANGNQLHYVEPDHLGTPRVVIEVARNVPVWTWDLKSEAFGNSVPNQNPDGDATPLVFDMRFPGQRYDAATGLSNNYFREYDSSTGRYATSDPIGLQGGVSTYGYASQNALSNIDPYGLYEVVTLFRPVSTDSFAQATKRKRDFMGSSIHRREEQLRAMGDYFQSLINRRCADDRKALQPIFDKWKVQVHSSVDGRNPEKGDFAIHNYDRRTTTFYQPSFDSDAMYYIGAHEFRHNFLANYLLAASSSDAYRRALLSGQDTSKFPGEVDADSWATKFLNSNCGCADR